MSGDREGVDVGALLCPNCGHHIDRHGGEILCFNSDHMRCEMKPSDILLDRLAVAEGALARVRAVVQRLADDDVDYDTSYGAAGQVRLLDDLRAALDGAPAAGEGGGS